MELKKLQTPLYEEFFSISNAAAPPAPVSIAHSEVVSDVSSVKPKSRSPSQASRRFSVVDGPNVARLGSHNKSQSKVSGANIRPLLEIHPSEFNEWKETLHNTQLESFSARYVLVSSTGFSLTFHFQTELKGNKFIAAQASLKDKGNGKKNLLKSFRGGEVSFHIV